MSLLPFSPKMQKRKNFLRESNAVFDLWCAQQKEEVRIKQKLYFEKERRIRLHEYEQMVDLRCIFPIE